MSDYAIWILTGGQAKRLGYTNKGLLQVGGASMIDRVLSAAKAAAQNVTFVGDENQFSNVGVSVISDKYRCGPIGGIASALEKTTSEWNLILAMDLPFVTSEFLSFLISFAKANTCQWLLPKWHGRKQPLCSVFHKSALDGVVNQMAVQDFRVLNLEEGLDYREIEIDEQNPFYSEKLLFNLNTFQDYEEVK